METKDVPVGVKVLSILEYIGAGILLLYAILTPVANPLMLAFAALGKAMLIFLEVIMLGLAVLEFFIARGLWRAQNWARILLIIFSCIGVVFGIISLIGAIGSKNLGASLLIAQGVGIILIDGLIAAYLLFSSEVKAAFA